MLDTSGAIVRGPDGAPTYSLTAADNSTLMLYYAGGFALLFGILALQTLYAYTRRDALALDDVERYLTRATVRAHALTAAVGATAAVLASLGPAAAQGAGLVFFVLGPMHGVLGWRRGAERRRAAPSGARRADVLGRSPRHVASSDAILQFGDTCLRGTVRATEHHAIRLQAVPDDPALAVRAARRKEMDCAFEAVERLDVTTEVDLERFVVVVATRVADGHVCSNSLRIPPGSPGAAQRATDSTSCRVTS